MRSVTTTAIACLAAALLLPAAALPVSAAPLRCRSGKENCVARYVSRTLLCHYKVQKKGSGSVQKCVDAAAAAFDGGADPAKGCFEKLETKYPPASSSPCTTYDDTATIEADVAAFVQDTLAAFGNPGFNPCAGKTRCTGKLAKSLLKCHILADRKGVAVDAECLDLAKTKFDGDGSPCKGCFRLLEDTHPPGSSSPCITFGDTHTVSVATRTFAECIATRLADPSSAPCAPSAPTCGPPPECKVFAGQIPDCSYSPVVADPPYATCAGPKILVDTTHANFHQITPLSDANPGRYLGFARLLSAAGYDVRDNYAAFSELLPGTDAKILVIANARACGAEAIDSNDVTAIVEWVQNGGSLLLIIDHQPFERAGALLSALGIDRLPGGSTRDPDCALTCEKCLKKCQTYFRSDGTLNGAAAIADGPNPPTTAVDQVSTFTGTAFSLSATPPAGATYEPLLTFPPGSLARSDNGVIDIGGYLQGVALQLGAGRVYVAGEAGSLTAQNAFGMQFTPENEQFLLNVIEWLDD